MSQSIAIAVGAHPDDVEFFMAGTLLQLKQVGYEIHYFTLANGSCGSREFGPAQLSQMRRRESQEGAKILGAVFHSSLVNDLEIFYDLKILRRVAAILREVKPSIILTHSPQDYMEDHMNTCRLVVSAAFMLGAPNFRTQPPRAAVYQDVTLYHAMPLSLTDSLRRRIMVGAYVDTSDVHATKLAALSAHRSQQNWLQASQGANSYLKAMEDMALELGRESRRFKFAEGWRRHLYQGYSQSEIDPLKTALGKRYLVNQAFEKQRLAGRIAP
ncbi:MAG TPA: PIG-L family deacetylase [Candidatus Paceibacterota bacterium]|nr:PIG-L family deacetylase [Verrucomicrobiota bacterium]HRY47155.1 PIG-L family deacetylase [Candidatus Paceibacterota bacterium]HSA01259.1 PIG-L family deacetylase [Candidatus Paceibacterota bacterium]